MTLLLEAIVVVTFIVAPLLYLLNVMKNYAGQKLICFVLIILGFIWLAIALTTVFWTILMFVPEGAGLFEFIGALFSNLTLVLQEGGMEEMAERICSNNPDC